jgi:two-component system phosphate regulon sensor histidine kinase PhoR
VKLGIRSKLFLAFVGLLATSVLVAHAYLSAALDAWLTEHVREDLRIRLQLVQGGVSSAAIAGDDVASWDRLADELGQRASARVTILRGDGVVLGDSGIATAGLAAVENHAGRPEVAAALASGWGEDLRASATLGPRMLYMAVPFRRAGSVVGVARIAMPLTEVDRAVARLGRLVTVGSLLALAVATVVAAAGAQWGSRRARALTLAARRMADGDLGARARASGEDELAELGRSLDQLAESLSRTLAELRAERDRLGGILDGMREGVLLLDREGRVALANPALRRMLALRDDIVGHWLFESVRHPELKGLLDRARDRAEPASGEIELAAGQRLVVRAAPLSHEPGGLLAVLFDVTNLRRLESMRRDFVANVSHELRTPVATVRSAAETLLGGATSDPDATREFLQIIERNAARLQRLVEDLLDLARIESRQHRLELEPIDLRDCVASVLASVGDRAAAKRIRLASGVAADAPPVLADRAALEQVLSNLLDNAVKYCPEGASVVVGAACEAGGVRVSVADDGPGIDPTHLTRLFERFYRVDAGRSRELGGTGLGLAIVKHLVEAMAGTVGVESAPGSGSCFFFTLPRAPGG